jgi:branched-subunit amino acid aminotransferase/4-amino-4-deoxychorismate lyase
VLELASSLGVEAVERRIASKELNQADEAFLTNSLLEIMPLTQVSGQTVGSGRPGKITRQLIKAYKALVRERSEG